MGYMTRAVPWTVLLLLALRVLFAEAVRLPRGPSRVTNRPITYTSVDNIDVWSPELPERVVARPVVYADQGRARRATIAEDIPSGTPLEGEYIIVYKPDVINVQAATASIQASAAGVAAAALSSDSQISTAFADVSSMVTVLSATQAPEGISSQALIHVAADVAPEQVTASLQALPSVQAVVQNRVVSLHARVLHQGTADGSSGVTACSPAYYAAAVRGQPAPGANLQWPTCLNTTTALALFGERCGDKTDKFRWNGIFAYNPSNGQQIGKCLYLRSKEGDASNIAKFFGDCGVSPTLFTGLPTNACLEGADSACLDANSVSSYTVQLSRSLCSGSSSRTVTFKGTSCGPNNALIQWNQMIPTGCVAVDRTNLDAKQQADWLGQCGVPPFQITGVPTRICGRLPGSGSSTPPPPANPPPSPVNPPSNPNPPPSPPAGPNLLPTMGLAPGESTANWGMATIGAYDRGTNAVTDARAAIAASNVKVVVIDTGVESSHPDLNVVEFMDFSDTAGSSNYGKDGHGHGTHVAGIIGARNQGAGVFGVVPGMPIIAMKVLGASGSGGLDKVWEAYAQVLARLQRGEKIAAINLSLGAPVSDANTINTECSWVSRIAAYGTAVVVAAGNAGTFYGSTIPALCGDAMTVTSLTATGSPSSFSNFAYTNSPASMTNTQIAAPGSDIYSTYKGGAYQSMSGTSMATPFAAGAFAQCVLAGFCKLSSSPGVTPAPTTNYPVMLAAAKQVPCIGGLCAPSWGSSYYYGYMLNVRPW